MNLFKIVTWFTFIFLFPNLSIKASVGTSGFDFLRRELSASSVALGNATVAHPKISNISSNPAFLSFIQQTVVNVTYVQYPVKINAGQCMYNTIVRNIPVAAKVIYFDYGTFEKRTSSGEKIGSFGANDWMISALIAKHWKNIHFGGEFGFVHSSIENYSASAILGNFGVVYVLPKNWNAKIGLEMRNIGVNTKKYVTSPTKLPTSIKFGGTKKLEHLPLTLLIQGMKWNDTEMYFSAGVDIEISDFIALRGGYSTLGNEQKSLGTKESTAGFTMGLGLKVKEYAFDFAYELQGIVGEKVYLQFNWLPLKLH
ncbi:MAG: PorV/PorQ family protein [bacterium]|nr:PorV/PorQ family protein [bacterium]